MFELLNEQPADKILALMAQFRADPRTDKIDLGVGVYKNAEGVTPVMRAVKAAEQQIWQAQTSKSYVGLTGDPAFCNAFGKLVLGDDAPWDRIAMAAMPGGTGAVRIGFDLLKMANPDVRVFVSDPTWPNHLSILKYLGMPALPYCYFDDATRGVDFDGMIDDLRAAKAGDVILLHGCCHNPTGANLTGQEWDAVIDLILERGLIPMVDIAYQGFGDGLDDDAAALRRLVGKCPEVLIAASCSKNFGIYRERTGLLMAVSETPSVCKLTQDTMAYLNRQTYSFPPDHGARIVSTILETPALRSEWQAELEETRLSMLDLRQQLADELRQRSNSERFDFLARHRGMFSRLGATPEQVMALREKHGIYMVGDSRINIAGLNRTTVPILAQAMIDCGV